METGIASKGQKKASESESFSFLSIPVFPHPTIFYPQVSCALRPMLQITSMRRDEDRVSAHGFILTPLVLHLLSKIQSPKNEEVKAAKWPLGKTPGSQMTKEKNCSKIPRSFKVWAWSSTLRVLHCKTTCRMVHHRSMAFKHEAEQVKASTGTNQTLKHCNEASMVDLHVDLDQWGAAIWLGSSTAPYAVTKKKDVQDCWILHLPISLYDTFPYLLIALNGCTKIMVRQCQCVHSQRAKSYSKAKS